MFRYHPDGWVYLGEFQATLAEFNAQRPGYVPAGDSETYDGNRHTVVVGGNAETSIGWPEGDEYLANSAAIVQSIMDARAAREAAEAQAAADADAAYLASLPPDDLLKVRLDRLALSMARKLAASMLAQQLMYDAMPAQIKPDLPQWVRNEFTEAIQLIRQAGG